MSGVIRLLPDTLANQIAAGEVVQRPASVVKELLENSIDAGATEITILIEESGKQLIQINDNGSGIDELDLRMSLERHATSKIKTTDDLSNILTLGFRGEALASIASIAHIDLKSRTKDMEAGKHLKVHGSKIMNEQYCQMPVGTQFSVKNIFYNTPARRKFLKSDKVEFKHILDEFQRVALANPEITFEFYHNDKLYFSLKQGNLRQRIIGIFGNTYNQRLIPVSEALDGVEINGFISRPENAKKSRGEQFLFVNGRFIKSSYLHHAIKLAYAQMLEPNQHPYYALFLNIDPRQVDINVHPTKQEIKFEDEHLVYNLCKVACRHALGQYAVIPAIDFDTPAAFRSEQKVSGISPRPVPVDSPMAASKSTLRKEWKSLYDGFAPKEPNQKEFSFEMPAPDSEKLETKVMVSPIQIKASYIITSIKSSLIVIDQHAAHVRILFEQQMNAFQTDVQHTQQSLFPEIIHFTPQEAEQIKHLLPTFTAMGFDIREMSQTSFSVQGIPSNLSENEMSSQFLHDVLTEYQEEDKLLNTIQEKLSLSIAKSLAIKKGKSLDIDEMKALIDRLFACSEPAFTPNDKKCYIQLELDYLSSLFN